ncbi:MAG TPA: hypothetical protein VH916_14640, partial [Dehalococcoidia bacterium]
RDGRRFTAAVRYTAPAGAWIHRFTARVLNDVDLAAELDTAGLAVRRLLDERGTWVLAGARELRTGP